MCLMWEGTRRRIGFWSRHCERERERENEVQDQASMGPEGRLFFYLQYCMVIDMHKREADSILRGYKEE